MSRGMDDAIRAAIEFAIADLVEVSKDSPRESLAVESQPRSAMYAFFKQKGWTAHVDAGYPDGRTKCDLRLRARTGEEIWVELKRGWYGKGLVNREGQRVDAWHEDVRRLKTVPDPAWRVFVLFGFFDRDPRDYTKGLPELIEGFHPNNRFHDSGPRPFRWCGTWNTNITTLQVWAWRF